MQKTPKEEKQRKMEGRLLRLEIIEASGVPAGEVLVEVSVGGKVVCSTTRLKSSDGHALFRRAFLLPSQTTHTLDCSVYIVGPDGTTRDSFCSVTKDMLETVFKSSAGVTRRFPLLSASNAHTDMRLKLKLEVHESHVASESAGDEAELGERYAQLLRVMAEQTLPDPPPVERSLPPAVPVKPKKSWIRRDVSRGKLSDLRDSQTRSELEACPGEVGIWFPLNVDDVRVTQILVKEGAAVFDGTPLLKYVLACDDEEIGMVSGESPNMEGLYSAPALSSPPSMYTSYGGGVPAIQIDGANDATDEHHQLCWSGGAGQVSRIMVTTNRDGVELDVGPAFWIDTSDRARRLAFLAAADSIDVASVSDMNARFQSATDRLVSALTSDDDDNSKEMLTSCIDLERVARDFSDTARAYGRIIISEMSLPLEEKTIRPLNLGGVLGGLKFVVQGILFKVVDGSMFKDYPDPLQIANKVQGHELVDYYYFF